MAMIEKKPRKNAGLLKNKRRARNRSGETECGRLCHRISTAETATIKEIRGQQRSEE
ncbi:hypothetical protein [Paenibacillus humicus]|uniref:hypothetical protein n=1 Tax=Paenibacillus humicus TaxID=412861 RepID=UPI001C3F8630|nr:hypothetical protein [Paenibacillus humicus]